jgi:carbonic anhydrase/acetyltransferase-like protein (isoleucine patch superfamily)
MGDVRLSPGANIWYGCTLRGDVAAITLEKNANLQDGVIVHCDFDKPQVIEEGVVVGHAAMLHGDRIGAHCLIGISATLLGGSTIGAESVIAAGSVVPPGMQVPPRSMVMGIPGKVVRSVTPEEIARTKMINARYQRLAEEHTQGLWKRVT